LKVLVIALLVSGLLSFAAATYLTVMIGFDFMPYSKARGTYVGLLFIFGSGFMYATVMALRSREDARAAAVTRTLDGQRSATPYRVKSAS